LHLQFDTGFAVGLERVFDEAVEGEMIRGLLWSKVPHVV